jgi:hypothetical protein
LAPSAARYVHPDYLIEAAHENMPPEAAVVDLMSIADERGMVKTAERLKPLLAAWAADPSEILPYPVKDPWWRATSAEALLRAFGAAGAPTDSVTFADGTYEMWKDLCGMVFRKGTLLGAGPVYPEFAAWWEAAGGRFRPIVDATLAFPWDALEQAIDEDPSVAVVYADTPFNATGEYPDPERFLALVRKARTRGIAVVADEAYANFLGPETTLIPRVADHPNLLVLRSLSKASRSPRAEVRLRGRGVGSLSDIESNQDALRSFADVDALRHGDRRARASTSCCRFGRRSATRKRGCARSSRSGATRSGRPTPTLRTSCSGTAARGLAERLAARGLRVAKGSQFAPTCGDLANADVRIRVPLSPSRIDALRARLDA